MNYAVIALQTILCVFIADFITGLVHWLEDTYSVPSTPLIGKYVAIPNIEHHRNPKAMSETGNFFTRVQLSVIISAVVSLIVYFLHCLTWQFILVAFLSAMGNEVHAWSHGAGRKGVKLLHDMGIVQTPAHHAKHHIPPFDRDYCILTNVLNPVLERIKFWRISEYFISLLGLKVKRMSSERDYL